MMRRVLLIAYAFPPRHSAGALRPAKIAKYLPEFGWEPIVLTRDWSLESSGLDPIRSGTVICTPYNDRFAALRRRTAGGSLPRSQGGNATEPRTTRKLARFAAYLLKEALAFPDEQTGWSAPALRSARRFLEEQRVSLLFSTSPPVTGHLIASRLQRETGIPWVADFRDLWTQNHYIRHTLPRMLLERRLEKRTLSRAAHLTTISSPLAQRLSELHGRPAAVITNGFDHEDFANDVSVSSSTFSITYTGQLYAGRRDPSLLFAATKQLVDEVAIGPDWFRIRFYGPEADRALVERLAVAHGIDSLVNHGGLVPYTEAVRKQQESTVLLLLNWDVDAERGVYTGKLFEYLGARRPILAIPRLNGVVDELLEKTRTGVSAGTQIEVADVLRGWIREFRSNASVSYGGVPAIIDRYSRRAQTEKLARLFDRLAANGED